MSDVAEPQATFGDNLVRAVKLVQSMRHDAPRPHPEVDPMAYPVLFTLWCEPRRVSDLADKMFADVSTVSRQVTHLVGLGLIERLPDPEDGRAHLLTLTSAGVDLLTNLRDQRDAWLLGLLEGWSEQDVGTFSAYLRRFAEAVERSRGETSHPPTTPSVATTQEAS